MALAWTPGTHGPVTGQQLFGVDNTTSSNCTGAAYGLLATMASATTAAYTDASRGSLATDGHWFCYELVSTSGTVWTAATPLAAMMAGLRSGVDAEQSLRWLLAAVLLWRLCRP